MIIGLPYFCPRLPRSGESSGSGLAPHHWHFSHPVFVMTGLRVTEVPFVMYRTTELFCFQGASVKVCSLINRKSRAKLRVLSENFSDFLLRSLNRAFHAVVCGMLQPRNFSDVSTFCHQQNSLTLHFA